MPEHLEERVAWLERNTGPGPTAATAADAGRDGVASSEVRGLAPGAGKLEAIRCCAGGSA